MIELQVNGMHYELDVPGETPLLWVLRDELGLTGTKYGCGVALCGACTVLKRDQPIRSCVQPVSALEGEPITTIEGLSREGLHPVQEAWLAEDVPQCGYCQGGQILTAVALLRQQADPSDSDIERAMTGILCRCGTFRAAGRAVPQADGGPEDET
jgi:aerobic-type carbon monoxide dehydrogenase small subunit (CoxS/CutS family)